MEIGKSKDGGGKKVFKVEDGDNVFRILPPLGKLAKSGKWSQYYPVQWGFSASNKKKRPFQDCRVVNFNTKMVEVESPAKLLRDVIVAKKDAVVEAFKTGKASKEQVTSAVDVVKKYNLDAKHYLNAVNLKGEIGLLKLNSTLMKHLKAAIKKYTDKGIDPRAVDRGIFFNFTRANETGKIQDYVFSVSPYYEEQADGSLREKIHVMDEAFIGRLEAEAFELTDLYPAPTPEQIQSFIGFNPATTDFSNMTVEQIDQLVSGNAEAVKAIDEVLGLGENSGSGGVTEGDPKTETQATTETAPQTQTAPVTQSAPATQETAPAATQTAPEVTEAATAQSTPVTQETPKAETQAAPATTGGNPNADMSDDEFLASIGAGG